MIKILLTGASGFIGSHVAEALYRSGFKTIALLRDPTRLPEELSGKLDVYTGDIRDPQTIITAAAGCSAIVHTAGVSNDWASRSDYQNFNVQGTLNVLEACRYNRIKHAIITGSISSYGEEDSTSEKDESSPFRSHYPYFIDSILPSRMNWYRDSKADATRQATAFAHRHDINCTILEPAWVFGEREFTTGFYTYAKSVKDGLHFTPGSTRNTFHVIYAADLAKAYVLAVQKGLKGVERIIIGNPQPESMHAIFSLFCVEAGLKPPRLLPKWIAYPPALAMEVWGTLRQSRSSPLLTRSRVNMFYDSIGFSTQKARRLLNFSCDYPLAKAIRKTVRWYREKGYL
jgi:nucleoside-diphosphate-sugar epimerase